MVGAPRFELGTSCSQSRRATGLRHAPDYREIILGKQPTRVALVVYRRTQTANESHHRSR